MSIGNTADKQLVIKPPRRAKIMYNGRQIARSEAEDTLQAAVWQVTEDF